MGKPTPKASAAPTAQPAAVPPRTRTEPAQQHPWEPPAEPGPARADEQESVPEPERPAGSAPDQSPARSDAGAGERKNARPGGRPRARARGKTFDRERWAKDISSAALKLASAQRKVRTRESELADVVSAARAAGADESVLRAWLVSAGLSEGDLPEQ